MPIPDFQTVMLPLLKITGDQGEHNFADVIERLAQEFQLTDEERQELIPSGRQARFNSKVYWAKTYLTQAALLESRGRGRFAITSRGLEVLRGNPDRIDIRFLEQYPEFRDFRNRTSRVSGESGGESGAGESAAPPPVTESQIVQTPEEAIESGYQALRDSLAQDLLETIKGCSPRFFEKLVLDLLLAMGYGGSRADAAQHLGRTGDGGIDGIVKEDRLGLDVIYVQAKRWEPTVGRPQVQAFVGSLEEQHAQKGVFITTSRFSQDARDFVGRIGKKIILIDGHMLAQLMIDYDVGVSETGRYVLKKVDTDYFNEE